MPVLQYVHLDVFTNRPFTGNRLAVFLDAAGIDERWTNLGGRRNVSPF
jgi:predicted PhzF superfamily epimerase YddE/YHI9